MALDLRQGGLRSVVRPRRWDGPKTTKMTATRIAECDLAASEAGDGNAKGDPERSNVISPKMAGGSGVIFSHCWFLNMLQKCHYSFDTNWR